MGPEAYSPSYKVTCAQSDFSSWVTCFSAGGPQGKGPYSLSNGHLLHQTDPRSLGLPQSWEGGHL